MLVAGHELVLASHVWSHPLCIDDRVLVLGVVQVLGLVADSQFILFLVLAFFDSFLTVVVSWLRLLYSK